MVHRVLPIPVLLFMACSQPGDAPSESQRPGPTSGPDAPQPPVADGDPDPDPDPAPDPEGPVQGDDPLSAQVRQELLAAGLRSTPAAPAVSDALFTLGQSLAFDPELSGNRDVACLTCHHPDLGTDDDRNLSQGVDGVDLGTQRTGGAVIPRNAPPLFNLHIQPNAFWDGRIQQTADGLITPAGAQLTPAMQAVFDFGPASAQAMFPVTSRIEMRGQVGDNELANLADDDFTGIWSAIMLRLGQHPEYVALFEAAYPGTDFEDMTFAHAANAIAGFEIAAFETRDSDFERFMRGEDTLTVPEMSGARAFVDAGCARCHSGAGLSDFQPHNTALAQIGPSPGHGPSGLEDFGFELAGLPTAPGQQPVRYAFRTPQLTNVGLTAPYGHAGQFDDLDRFVAHYNNPIGALNGYNPRNEVDDPTLWAQHFTGGDDAIAARLDPLMRNPRADVGSIVAFLNTLDDPAAEELGWTVPQDVASGVDVERP